LLELSYNELYSSTPRSFNNRLNGFKKHQEQMSQNQWEQTRIILMGCLQPHSKKNLKPKDVLPLPWDEKYKPKKEIATKEHIQKVLEKYEKIKFNKI
tara:strand:+ start:190 stop:480 length:291 start_codon:yes stop_codon:yes gene_type:complete